MSELSDIELFSTETLKAPYGAYKTLRDNAPVYFVPEMNVHVVTRYDLLRDAIKDTETYSSKFDGFLQQSQRMLFELAAPEVQTKVLELNGQMLDVPPTMLTLDEPEHTRYRSLVSKLFVASQIKAAQPTVQKVIDDSIANFITGNQVDFVERFASPIPLRIIGDRLGIPEDDRAFFAEAATSAAGGLRLTPLSDEQMIERAELALGLQQLLVKLVEARRAKPADDMITILANSKLDGENRHLTHGECLSILNQFLVAGHETTTSAFGWGMLLLCRTPTLQDKIRDNEKNIKTFVEEALRIEAPVQGLPRLVTKDTELGGYPLKAGSLIMLRYGAANRDERQFKNPDVVDINRANAGSQMAFSAGVHFCIGAPLARQELNLGFKSLMQGMKNIRLNPTAPEPEPEASFILRNLPYLHIEFDRL